MKEEVKERELGRRGRGEIRSEGEGIRSKGEGIRNEGEGIRSEGGGREERRIGRGGGNAEKEKRR